LGVVAVPGTADDTSVVARGSRRLDRRRSARSRGGVRKRVTVYLTGEERALLEAQAEVSGRSLSSILVDAALHPASLGDGADLSARGGNELVEQLRDYRRKLVGVTTNLNQIAYHANTTSEVPADFPAVVDEIHRLHDEINAMLLGVRR
jgi:hypothetical protein